MTLRIIMFHSVIDVEFQAIAKFDFTDKFASFGIQVKWLKDLQRFPKNILSHVDHFCLVTNMLIL